MPIQNSKASNAIMAGLIIFTLIFDISNSAYSNEHPVNKDPAAYLIQKLKSHDIILLGTTHKRPAILQFIAGLIPHLEAAGVTHIGIEMPTDHQDDLNAYLNTGTGLASLYVHPQIDCPKYRNVLKTLHGLKPENRPSVVGYYLPTPKTKVM
jgi:hypothetical protein